MVNTSFQTKHHCRQNVWFYSKIEPQSKQNLRMKQWLYKNIFIYSYHLNQERKKNECSMRRKSALECVENGWRNKWKVKNFILISLFTRLLVYFWWFLRLFSPCLSYNSEFLFINILVEIELNSECGLKFLLSYGYWNIIHCENINNKDILIEKFYILPECVTKILWRNFAC